MMFLQVLLLCVKFYPPLDNVRLCCDRFCGEEFDELVCCCCFIRSLNVVRRFWYFNQLNPFDLVDVGLVCIFPDTMLNSVTSLLRILYCAAQCH